MRDTSSAGARAELLIAADLMNKGFAVYRAVSPSAPYDLIADNGTLVWFIECRTGRVDLMSSNRQIWFPTQHGDRVNLFAVYVPEPERICYFALELYQIDPREDRAIPRRGIV